MSNNVEFHQQTSEWRYAVLGALKTACRVCTTTAISDVVRSVKPKATPSTVNHVINGLIQAGALTKVSRGIYLNQGCRPAASLTEAAQYIRNGAVISL